MKHCDPREVHILYLVSDSWGPKQRSVAEASVLILLLLLFCSFVPSTAHCHHHFLLLSSDSQPHLIFGPLPRTHSPSLSPSLTLPIFLFKLLLFLSFSF